MFLQFTIIICNVLLTIALLTGIYIYNSIEQNLPIAKYRHEIIQLASKNKTANVVNTMLALAKVRNSSSDILVTKIKYQFLSNAFYLIVKSNKLNIISSYLNNLSNEAKVYGAYISQANIIDTTQQDLTTNYGAQDISSISTDPDLFTNFQYIAKVKISL